MTQVLHLSSRWISLSSPCWYQPIYCFVSGRISPQDFKMFSVSPQQAYSFRCWFSNNSIITFLEGCFPSSFVAEVVIFFSILSFPTIQLLFFRSGGIAMLLSSLIIPFMSKIMFFPFAYPSNRSVVPSFQVLSFYQVLPLFYWSAV